MVESAKEDQADGFTLIEAKELQKRESIMNELYQDMSSSDDDEEESAIKPAESADSAASATAQITTSKDLS